MASSDTSSITSKPPMTSADLIAFVKDELDADKERQAQVTPANASELPTGCTLDLSHKNIESLPVEVVLLIRDKVERLALSHNPRIVIPSEIAQCDRLRYLNLRWNRLKHFPEAVLSLSKLEILDISKNNIDSIPEDIGKMTNLKFLAVARNQIKRLPLALGDMNLVKLKFDENPIEFPPPDALKPPADRVTPMVESEKDKDMCQQVKRYMRTTAMRQRLKTTSEEDLSESNVETPRPPKRSVTGGRFPVRPSISGIEGISNLNADSPPDNPPPVPQRSHARIRSNVVPPAVKRPGITPLLTGSNDASRSRSETVATSANIRNRRQGYVPRKNTGLNSFSEMSSQLSARSSQFPALTPPHSRAPSMSSNHLAVGSGNDSSSAAVSPVEGFMNRNVFSQKLASLPESRNSRLSTITSTKAMKRAILTLSYLSRPMADVARRLSNGSPKKMKTKLERTLFNATTLVEELDRLIMNANDLVEENTEIYSALMTSIIRTAISAFSSFAAAVGELRFKQHEAVSKVDAFHIRTVITAAYSSIIECRNVCSILGFHPKDAVSRTVLKGTQENWWPKLENTITPTQQKSAGSSRRRGATILPSGAGASHRGVVPPVPLNSGSRSNTMTSMITPTSMPSSTPRYQESFTAMSSVSNQPSRSNTLRSINSETDGEEGPDNVYLKLKACCDLASQTLPSVRADLAARKANADRVGLVNASKQYAHAVNKCDFVIATNHKLLARLQSMRVGDTLRHMKEFSQMTENFGRDWTEFANQVVALNNHGIDIGNIRKILRPLQHAVKDANKAASQTPPPPSMRAPLTAGLYGGFPSSINTGIAQSGGLSGHVTPVPATPLGAALGPAVQATVPPTPMTAYNSPEHYPSHQARGRHPLERSDTMATNGYGRR